MSSTVGPHKSQLPPEELVSSGSAASSDATRALEPSLVDGGPVATPDDKTIISKKQASSHPLRPPVVTPQHLGETLIGQRLDHYDLVDFVGGGGMGAVFRAHDSRLGRTVAVKVLSRDQTDEETIRRFRNEAQSAARLDHPNIARVYFVGEDAGWNYIVFEFIEGINLRDLVEQRGPLSLDDALSYTLQIAEALSHASSRDVVHRDIKPSNVLVTPSGAVKLVDMGLARLHQVESSSDDLTASGVTLGTFDYISPEQARDPRSADVRSDIYSLGCTLYFMLVGRPPFPDGTALQKLLRHNGDDPPDVRLFRPELSPRITALLNRMLAKRPSQRQQSPEVLIQEIVQVAEHLGLQFARRQGSAWISPPTVPTFWSRLFPLGMAAVVLVIVLVALDALVPPNRAVPDVSMSPNLLQPVSDRAAADEIPSDSDTTNPPAAQKPLNLRRGNAIDAPKPVDDKSRSSDSDNPLLDVPSDAGTAASGAPGRTVSAGDGVGKTSTAPTLPVGSNAADSTKPSGATMAPSAPVGRAAAVARLIVQPSSSASAPEGAELFESLAEACRRATELGGAEIELHFDGVMREKPFDITANRLTIRAGAGFHPQIVFQPELQTSADQRQMIRVAVGTSGRVSIQGVQFRLELPAEPSFGWSLFALSHVQGIDLSDCVITVQDEGALGNPVHEQVAVFTTGQRRTSDVTKLDEEGAMAPVIALSLTRCIVRGEATLVSMPEETPFKLDWNQGLLITPRRLLETGGTDVKPKWFGRVEIDLDQVTAYTQQGLYQMKRRGGAAHQLDLDVVSKRSILYTAKDAPLFEFVDVPTVDDVKLNFDGADNCYPWQDAVFLRLKPSLAEVAMDFDLENRSQWSVDRRPDLGVEWKSPAPDDMPLHERGKQHYLQVEGAANDAGFDPAQLPDVLAAPEPPSPLSPASPPSAIDPPPPPPIEAAEATSPPTPSAAAPPDGTTMPTTDRRSSSPSTPRAADSAMPTPMRGAMPMPGP